MAKLPLLIPIYKKNFKKSSKHRQKLVEYILWLNNDDDKMIIGKSVNK